MGEPLRVGIVGYGFATATFHAPLIRAAEGLSWVAVSSRDPDKVHAKYPEVQVLSQPLDLIDRPDLDLIIVPTPNDTHFPLARAALEAGKSVVVDKPFTLTSVQAQELVSLADSKGLFLSVFHNRRWDSDFLTLKALIERGTLGQIVHYESRMDRFRPEVRVRWRESSDLGAGLWFDLGPHLLDQALVLFGEPDGLVLNTGLLRDGALSDDWFFAILDYPDRRILLSASVMAAQPSPRFVVHGLKGTWQKSGFDPQEEALKAGAIPGRLGWGEDPVQGILTRPDLDETSITSIPGAYSTYYPQVAAAIRGQGPNPVSPREALRVMRWLDAGRVSAREGRRVTATP